jgi:hypothetical protein
MSEAAAARKLSAYLERMHGRTARWAYWQKSNGPMFVYNTERLHLRDESDPAHGQFESCVFIPVGPGSRSGKAKEWKELKNSRSAHVLRKDAKSRAYRLYKGWLENGKVEL